MSHHHDAPHQRLGGKLGPRLAAIVSQSHNDHLRRTASLRAKIGTEAALGLFRTMTREKRQHVSPLWELYLGGENTPPELEALLQFIAHGEGELSEMLNSGAMARAAGTSIMAGVSNYLAPLNQKLIEAAPFSLIEPSAAAQAVVMGLMSDGAGSAEAAKGGINGHRYGIMKQMSENWPGFPQLLDLWRRGLISEGEVREGMRRLGMLTHFEGSLLNLKREHLGPADAALATLRGVIDEGAGASIAAVAGINASDFHILVENTGEPPGLMQLLEAYRRGFIDKGRLDKGIKQSRVRNEWHDVVEKLRFSPASTSDALRGVVQNHLSHAEGKKIAEDNGQRPEDWNWMVEVEGNPPGTMQMLELWNRGKVSTAQVDQAIRESRLKNKYVGPVKDLAVKLPEGRQITSMIGRGAISHARGMELLRDHGYERDIAEALLHSAVSGQVLREKQVAQGAITALYENHGMTKAEAKKHLESLGYHSVNADLLLTLADLKREHTLRNAALSPVKAAYVARHIDEAEAGRDIDKIGVPASERDYLLALWTIERSAHRRSLTEAQIIAANVKGLFSDPVTISRLEHLGYSGSDAKVLMDLEKKRTTPA